MKKNLEGKILQITEIAKEIFEIKIESALEEISAGQFFQVLCPPKTMRRPFGAAGFENGILKISMPKKEEEKLTSKKIEIK